MRALIISNSGSNIINVMNFLISTGYSPRNIITITDTRQSIVNWWSWMVERDKCFVYIDPTINDINFSSELFTPLQLRSLIFSSPNVKINIFISSPEPFELLWVYAVSKLSGIDRPTITKSHLYGQATSTSVVVTGKNVDRQLHDIHGLCYSDIVEYYGMKVSFSRSIELFDKFI
jgi:hypothetical protein